MRFKYVPVFAREKMCQVVGGSEFGYFIKTARNAAFERFKIRRWFRSKQGVDRPLKNYFFMLGTDRDGNDFVNGSSLDYERAKYDDIIVADFEDTYNNLPTKTQSIYHFIMDFCSDKIKVCK